MWLRKLAYPCPSSYSWKVKSLCTAWPLPCWSIIIRGGQGVCNCALKYHHQKPTGHLLEYVWLEIVGPRQVDKALARRHSALLRGSAVPSPCQLLLEQGLHKVMIALSVPGASFPVAPGCLPSLALDVVAALTNLWGGF